MLLPEFTAVMASKLAKGIRLYPGSWKTVEEKLADGVWPWVTGIRARLPMHYKMRYVQKHMQKPLPVHWKPIEANKYTIDKEGKRSVWRRGLLLSVNGSCYV